VKALENAQSVQLARTRVLINAFERSKTHRELLDPAKLLVAILEPDPRAAMNALADGHCSRVLMRTREPLPENVREVVPAKEQFPARG
ncbi:MAG: hypothetical protein L0Z50_16810, partial [Verrucomicrobiales bacterium]|nr:hypothetical protein [Verrucomicrobiales bacterium]